ncbi:MBL fold metallo-hydrolase [Streptomyces sp. NPDC051684]|uniref:MBL fold metallo-hydrolase n=1 Tax=Streptomyces sp. NPDC051684 TaxID=3365670 RepID=UPI0037B5A433
MHPSPLARPTDTPAPAGRAVEIADGVHAYLQTPGGWCLNNAGIIVSRGQSALFDTAATETRARALRDTALRLNPAPPRTVVTSHFHGDHAFGNFVFPEALVIGHERTRTELTAAGLHLTGMWPHVDWGDIQLAPPTVTFRERLTLHVGDLRVELEHIGPAHTSNDTVLWLPERRVLFTGDLTMNGVTPFFLMGSLAGSFAALDRLRGYGARTVVPGHGPVGGPEVFDAVEGYLRLVQSLAEQGLRAGWTAPQAARRADLGPYARHVDPERLCANLLRAYAELEGLPADAPLPDADKHAALDAMIAFNGGTLCCRA